MTGNVLTFPPASSREPDARRSEGNVPAPTEGILRGCEILIVEDEYILASDLRRELEQAGAVVLGPSPDVRSALAIIDAHPQLAGVVLDIRLGGESSFMVADAILDRDIPLVFATGYDRDALPERYRDVLRCEKPIDAGQIRSALGQAVGNRGTARGS